MTSKHLLLYRLTELMLEHEQQMLPVDLLFDDTQIGDFVKNIQIDSPYQQMLFDGVLTESVREEKLFVSFTVEGYFHFVLGEVIYKRTQGLGADTLKQIVEENKLNGAKEGVEQCLIRDVNKNDLSRLIWLIDEGANLLDICIVPLANAFLNTKDNSKNNDEFELSQNNQIKRVMDYLLDKPSENDIYVLENTLQYLEKNQLHKILKLIFIKINKLIKPDSNRKTVLYIKSIQFLNSNERKNKILEIARILYQNEAREMTPIYLSLSEQLAKVGEIDYAIEFTKKAIDFEVVNIEKDNFLIAKLYNGLASLFYEKAEFMNSIKYSSKANYIFLKYFNSLLAEIAETYHDMGSIWFQLNNHQKSKKYLEKSLQIRIKAHGNQHPNTAETYNNLGRVYELLGLTDNGLNFKLISLSITKNIYGEFHEKTGLAYHNIGISYSEKGDLNSALDYFNKSLSISININGISHKATGLAYHAVASVLHDINDHVKAIEFYKTSIEILNATIGIEHPHTIFVCNDFKLKYDI